MGVRSYAQDALRELEELRASRASWEVAAAERDRNLRLLTAR
jgi:hypothetical protein